MYSANKIKLTLALLCISLLGACGTDVSMYKKSVVDAVYWHEGDRYTVAIINDGVVEMRELPSSQVIKVNLYIDVKNDEQPWYECDWHHNKVIHSPNGKCDIHIKSIEHLKTSDWNHGKFGSGSTTKLN